MLEIDPLSFGEETKMSLFIVVVVIAEGENASGSLLESPEDAECNLPFYSKKNITFKILLQET
mgnify:FL=1